jgi:hypothetical protein
MNRQVKTILIFLALATLFGVYLAAQQPTKPVDTGGSAMTTTQGGTAPASELSTGCTYNTSFPTLSNGQASQVQCDSSGRLFVNPGSLGFGVSGVPTTVTANAFTMYHASSAAAANIKASAGNLYGLVLGNSGSIPCWLQLFNNSGTPTAGTSVIDSYMVQAGVTIPLPPGLTALENFATGIAAAGATTDSGATTTGCTTTFSVTAYFK